MVILLDTAPRATSAKGDGSAFFCSTRDSNQGCGKTFSLLWNHLISRASVCPLEVIKLLTEVVDSTRSLHHLWFQGRYQMSLTSAYRWRRKWQNSLAHLRSQLHRDHPPPRTEGHADALMIQHLSEAFGEDSTGWVPSFQQDYQRDFFLSSTS